MSTSKNQGEGNREAARRYNQDAREHAAKTDTEAEAKQARRDLCGPEKDALKKAEKAGKAKAKEFDPNVKRD
ncbi:MAG: hypothetical protein RIM84_16930 [Alphaproteobacteria bacterium]